MKVFLDTNVLASAVATRGLCADVLREVFTRHELVVSPAVLQELRRVLGRKFRLPRQVADDVVELVRQDAIPAAPKHDLALKLKDPSDLCILSAAVSEGADVFVTGDRELLSLGAVRGMPIVSPRQFWEGLARRRTSSRRPS